MNGGANELSPLLVPDTMNWPHYLDNLRSTAVVLIIVNNVALTSSVSLFARYVPTASSIVYAIFTTTNQTYLMGLLFLLSGHFASLSSQHTSSGNFVRCRLTQLGIPTLFWTVIGEPLAEAFQRWGHGNPAGFQFWLERVTSIRGVRGPAWFTALLLCFDLVFAATRHKQIRIRSVHSTPYLIPIGLASVVVCSCAIRARYPIGWVWAPLNLQPAFLPQYILAYLAGHSLPTLDSRIKYANPARALMLSVILAPLTLVLIYIALWFVDTSGYKGGNSFPAFIYETWNELSFYFLTTTLIAFFATNTSTRKKWGTLERYSYCAYLVHPLVVSVFQVICSRWTVSIAFSGIVVAVGSWGLSWCLVQIPVIGMIV